VVLNNGFARSTVDFSVFEVELREMAEKAKRAQISTNNPLLGDEGQAGEGKQGFFCPE